MSAQLETNTTNLQDILNTVNELPTATSINITVDSALSTTSKNPVQNKVVTEALNNKADNEHFQGAETVTSGAFGGSVAAGALYQSPSISLLRNSKLVSTDTDPAIEGEIFWTYE